jgi:hypothetical protein
VTSRRRASARPPPPPARALLDPREIEKLIVLMALAIACGRSDPPRLTVSPLPASGKASVDARYQLRNVGGQALALDGVVPACGCAATSQLPETLAPGASSRLDVRCRSPRTVGDVVRELRLRSSDPSNPEIAISVTLAGARDGPDPATLYFGYVPVGESLTRDVVLPMAVAAESLTPPAEAGLTIEPMPLRADGAHGVRVRFAPRVAGVVRADLDLGPAGGVLPVTAVGYGSVLAFPAEVRLSSAAGAAGLPAITIMGLGAEPLAITQVDYPPGLAGELRTVIPGQQFRLALRGRLHADATGFSGAAIRLRRDAGGDPLLTIPVVSAPASGAALPKP